MSETEPAPGEAAAEEIVVRYRLTFEEMARAQSWHRRVALWPIFRWLMRVSPVGLIVCGAILIYYWDPPDTIYMLLPYKKTDQEDLAPEQLKFLRVLVKEWLT